MQKSFKTEINPTDEQKLKIRRTIGTCRYVYNFYLDQNRKRYEKGEKFMSGKSFSVWLNNEYLPQNPEYAWIKEVSSKSVKRSLENACTAFSRFFKGQSHFPRYKKKNKSNVKMYFVKTTVRIVSANGTGSIFPPWDGYGSRKRISSDNERRICN